MSRPPGSQRRVLATLLMLLFLTGLVTGFILVALLGGCATPYPGRPDPGATVNGAPDIDGVRWSEAPDTRLKITDVGWCDDQYGHAARYPCKWDTRLRPAPGWASGLPPVAVWVHRDPGCLALLHRLDTTTVTDVDPVAWSCYYAPGS